MNACRLEKNGLVDFVDVGISLPIQGTTNKKYDSLKN